MKRIIYIFALFVTLLVSCNKNDNDISSKGNLNSTEKELRRPVQPVVLGAKKENPFSVENMKIALDTLREIVKQSDGSAFKVNDVDQIELETTDLYVRFLPADSAQFKTLKQDTSLILFDFPLDYNIKQNGDYYHDPSVSTKYTWLYATVKPGYVPPAGIKYEIIKELFIPEHSEYYSEVLISDNAAMQSKKKAHQNSAEPIDTNIFNALCAISFKLTGNEKELKTDSTIIPPLKPAANSNSQIKKVRIENCTYYRIKIGWTWVSWTACDPFYIPNGSIKCSTPNGEVGVKGVKVRMWRWFQCDEARTNNNGDYVSSQRFNSLWVGNNIDYQIHFHGVNGDNSWSINVSIAGAACLWSDYYGVGSCDASGMSYTFGTWSEFWGKCVQNNAIYDYINIARTDGISLPPRILDIATENNPDFTSSAPLFKNHVNMSLLYAFPDYLVSQAISIQIGTNALLGWALPDLILRYTKNINDYNRITSIAWHELTHASQLSSMIAVRGFNWASDYWSQNVYQQAANTFKDYDGDGEKDGDSYGNKGDERWEIIALSEGWANYRQWSMSSKHLSFKVFIDEYPDKYAYMFNSLHSIGCSNASMESSLSTFSFIGFRDRLMAYYPNINDDIANIINFYLWTE